MSITTVQDVLRVGERKRSQIKVHSVINRYKFSREMFTGVQVSLQTQTISIGITYMGFLIRCWVRLITSSSLVSWTVGAKVRKV